MFRIFTDTDTDFTPELAKKYGYTLISMPYSAKEGEEVYPYVDFEAFDGKAFYDSLRKGSLPKTFALSPVKYIQYFEDAFINGQDVLYVHFSRAMSGTFNAMDIAIKELKEKYPERKVYTVDTKGITIGSYSIVKKIGEMYVDGASIEQILEWAKTEVDKYAVYFYADDLKFFARSGRVSGIAATMGGLLGIRPILTMNSEGKMVSVAKAKGRKATIKKIFDYVEELKEDILSHPVVIGHADAIELAKQLEKELKARYGDSLDTEIVQVNPTAGSHCGPDTVGISFYAKHR